MGQLSHARFKDKYKASSGPYKGKDYQTIAISKIKDKSPFFKGTNDSAQKVFGLSVKENKGKYQIHYTNSKSSKKETGNAPVTAFFKDPDFGGGKGSGGGSDDTTWTESMQCYYLSILFNTSATKLDNKNTTLKHLQAQDNNCFTYDKSTKLNAKKCFDNCPEDWFQDDVFIKTANAIFNSPYAKPFKKASKVYFHRGSPYMKAVYDNKKKAQQYDKKINDPALAPGSFSDDKWNPGDIWMSILPPTNTTPFADKKNNVPLEWTSLREAVRDTAETHTLGVSLKKVSNTATVTPFNTRKRTHNLNTKLVGYTFGQTGDFFNSADMYMYFNDGGIMQLRATATTKSWQGEMKGKYAAAGKIGGGNVNYYVEQVFGKSIGFTSIRGKNWQETYYSPGNLKKMHDLYTKYINKQQPGTKKQPVLDIKEFKKAADSYTSKGNNASRAFYFGKYMCLLFLETISAENKSVKLDQFSKLIVRYAMSNTDISTFFIKVS